MALDLVLVRHGATAWTQTGQHTGNTDLPMLPEGEDEVRRLGPILAGLEPVAAFSSDLGRARRTAELAGFPHPTVTPLLREFDYGEYEGVTSEEIWRRRPDWQIFRDGCPGGESPEQVYERAQRFLRLVDGMEGTVLVFSHGHLLRTLGVAWSAQPVANGAALALDTAAVCRLRGGSHGRVVQRWNWRPEL